MGPPRRARSTSITSPNAPTSPSPDVARAAHATPDGAASIGMSPAYRYAYNLKVLRRHDPSIVSIFDQFHHICVYHFDGEKWEKQGYEGTMFLFERQSYPPYGFYVLNRVGSDDYVQLLYPEDAYKIMTKEILAIRSFPAFASARIARATASLPPGAATGPDAKFHPAFAFNPASMEGVDKGPSQVIGLWSYDPVTLREVLWRVHSYLVAHEPYPEQFRYGPDRPQPSGRVPSRNGMANPSHHRSTSSASLTGSERFAVISESDEDTQPSTAKPTSSAQGASELDKLFAKLGAPSQPTPQKQHPQPPPPAQQPNLLAQLTAQAPNSSQQPNVLAQLAASAQAPTSATNTSAGRAPSAPPRGLSLLDTIFASATPPPQAALAQAGQQLAGSMPFQNAQPPLGHHAQSPQARYAQAQPHPQHQHQRQASDHIVLPMALQHQYQQHHPQQQHPQQQQSVPMPIPMQAQRPPLPQQPVHHHHHHYQQQQYQQQNQHQPPILSPRPKPSALPQVLNQDVLHSLLGMPRTPSSASSGPDGEPPSASEPSSRDTGFTQAEHAGANGHGHGYPYAHAYGQRGQPAGARLMPGQSFAGSVNSMASLGASLSSAGSPSGQALGDVTPRPPLKGFASPGSSDSGPGPGAGHDMAFINERLGIAAQQVHATMQRHSSSNSDATITGSRPYHFPPPQTQKQANYPNHAANPPRHPDLNSPAPGATPARTGSVKAPTGPSVSAPDADARSRTLVPFTDPSALWPYPPSLARGSDRRQNGAAGGENDDGSSNGDADGDVVELDFADTSALSDPSAFAAQQMQQARGGRAANTNGNGNGTEGAGGRKAKKSKKERAAEGRAAKERAAIEASWDVPASAQSSAPAMAQPQSQSQQQSLTPVGGGGMDKAAAADALLASLLSREAAPGARGEAPPRSFAGLGRNDFVREVLTLIHTDSAFVDSLYGAYAARAS